MTGVVDETPRSSEVEAVPRLDSQPEPELCVVEADPAVRG